MSDDPPVTDECVGTVGDLGGDGFGDGKPALTKGDYHLPAVLTKKPLKRKIKETAKITLSWGQLKRLIKGECGK